MSTITRSQPRTSRVLRPFIPRRAPRQTYAFVRLPMGTPPCAFSFLTGSICGPRSPSPAPLREQTATELDEYRGRRLRRSVVGVCGWGELEVEEAEPGSLGPCSRGRSIASDGRARTWHGHAMHVRTASFRTSVRRLRHSHRGLHCCNRLQICHLYLYRRTQNAEAASSSSSPHGVEQNRCPSFVLTICARSSPMSGLVCPHPAHRVSSLDEARARRRWEWSGGQRVAAVSISAAAMLSQSVHRAHYDAIRAIG